MTILTNIPLKISHYENSFHKTKEHLNKNYFVYSAFRQIQTQCASNRALHQNVAESQPSLITRSCMLVPCMHDDRKYDEITVF